MSVTETLDARGLLCPLPVIRTQDRVKNLVPLSAIMSHGKPLTGILPDAKSEDCKCVSQRL